MKNGTRHPNAKAVSLHGRPGRPKSVPLAAKAPACETCRNLVITKAKKCACGKGHGLNPDKCGEFSSASIMRNMIGGTTGIPPR